MQLSRWWGSVVAVGILTGCAVRGVAPERFPSPDKALVALEQVVVDRSDAGTRRLFGSAGDYLLDSGDPILDEQRALQFQRLFDEHHALRARPDGSFIVVAGRNEWPFPVPLVPTGGGWEFDAAAGQEEILSRRIGQNELSALRAARTVYLAQRVYAAVDRDGDGVREYAGRLISSPGSMDGLYWPVTAPTIPESPLGPAVARAADENYVITPGGHPQPFHGYYHRILPAPPVPAASGDPLDRPGRYWFVSTPARWGESGVMSFASNERGWIYERNLGPDFRSGELEAMAIDDAWRRIQ